ncbi:Hypothetical predicted protein [Pelobates cultripes]|uniref:Uncharacterized protein n=1 Tax=Pelobates cultripes TaxID=61616 RepID=A0AAD1SH67_PELCU|nr:Hypothetical predicted protein [Pelobates cultripes]
MQTLTAELRKDIQEIGNRAAHLETRVDEHSAAHNCLAYKLQELTSNMEKQSNKLADLEDRLRRNNLRFRGIPEKVGNNDLDRYLQEVFLQLTPELHPDQLIIDRAHRLRRPAHLPTSSTRDVIARIHFFHAKERILRATRNAELPDKFRDIKIFSDLLAETLQFRKSLAHITTALRGKV